MLYLQRRALVDPALVKNVGGPKVDATLAQRKWRFKGDNGFYPNEKMQAYFQNFNQTHVGEVRELDKDPIKIIKSQLLERGEELMAKVKEKREDLKLKYFRKANHANHKKQKAMDAIMNNFNENKAIQEAANAVDQINIDLDEEFANETE